MCVCVCLCVVVMMMRNDILHTETYTQWMAGVCFAVYAFDVNIIAHFELKTWTKRFILHRQNQVRVNTHNRLTSIIYNTFSLNDKNLKKSPARTHAHTNSCQMFSYPFFFSLLTIFALYFSFAYSILMWLGIFFFYLTFVCHFILFCFVLFGCFRGICQVTGSHFVVIVVGEMNRCS